MCYFPWLVQGMGMHACVWKYVIRVRLYWRESNSASRWVPRKSNLTSALSSNRDQRNNFFFTFAFAECKWTFSVGEAWLCAYGFVTLEDSDFKSVEMAVSVGNWFGLSVLWTHLHSYKNQMKSESDSSSMKETITAYMRLYCDQNPISQNFVHLMATTTRSGLSLEFCCTNFLRTRDDREREGFCWILIIR